MFEICYLCFWISGMTSTINLTDMGTFQVDTLALHQLSKHLLNPATPRALRVHSWAAPFRAWPGSYDRNNGDNPPIIIITTSNPEGREIIVGPWLGTKLVMPSIDFDPAYRRFRLQRSCKGYACHPDLAHIFRLLCVNCQVWIKCLLRLDFALSNILYGFQP